MISVVLRAIFAEACSRKGLTPGQAQQAYNNMLNSAVPDTVEEWCWFIDGIDA